jgi:hypothetical protein
LQVFFLVANRLNGHGLVANGRVYEHLIALRDGRVGIDLDAEYANLGNSRITSPT